MKNIDKWQPTRLVKTRKGMFKVTKNEKYLSISSRLVSKASAFLPNEIIPQYAKGKLLDLGCGKVPLYEAYKDYISENICIDWEGNGQENIFLDIVSDINKRLPLKNDEFNTIISSSVIEHLQEPEQIFREMHRVLKKEGIAILSVPFLYPLHEEPYDYFRYTKYALEMFASKNHFKVLECRTTGGMPEVLTDIFAKNIKSIPIIGRFIAIIAQQFTYLFVKTPLGKKLSKKTSQRFPLGYVMVIQK